MRDSRRRVWLPRAWRPILHDCLAHLRALCRGTGAIFYVLFEIAAAAGESLMIGSLICVVSVAALLQFFISYSRSIIAGYRKAEISEAVRELVRSGEMPSSSEFAQLLQFVRLCPQRGDDQTEIRVVRAYYFSMGWLRSVANSIAPRVSRWAEQERENCAYFAAVALDRRIASSREFIAQQMPGR